MVHRCRIIIVLQCDLELLHQGKRLLVDRVVVPHHVLGKAQDLLVFGFRECLLCRLDVDRSGRVGDMSDLGICRFVRSRRRVPTQAGRSWSRLSSVA